MQLFRCQRESKYLAKQFLNFFICEKEIGTVDDSERILGAQSRQRQWRNVARDDNEVDDVREISNQSIEHSMYWRFRAQVMVIIQYQDQLLLNAFQELVQKNIGRTLRVLRQFVSLL